MLTLALERERVMLRLLICFLVTSSAQIEARSAYEGTLPIIEGDLAYLLALEHCIAADYLPLLIHNY